MALSFKQTASAAATSATLASTDADDMIIVYAFRNGDITVPSLAAGYTSLYFANINGTASLRVGWKKSAGGETSTGTWTNAERVTAVVLAGQDLTDPIGASDSNSAITTSVLTFQSIILERAGDSWVVAGCSTTSTTPPSTPTTMTVRNSSSGAALFDTNGPVTTFPNRTTTGAANSDWLGFNFEVMAPVPPPEQQPMKNGSMLPMPVLRADGRHLLGFIDTTQLALLNATSIPGIDPHLPTYDWPNPLRARNIEPHQFERGIPFALFHDMVMLDIAPQRLQHHFPNPVLQVRNDDTGVTYLWNGTLYSDLGVYPFSQADYPLPLVARTPMIYHDAIPNLVSNTIQPLPFAGPWNQTDWPNPLIAGRSLEERWATWNSIYAIQHFFLLKAFDWPNPLIAGRANELLSYLREGGYLLYVIPPFYQTEWPLPVTLVPSAQDLRTHLHAVPLQLLGQDQFFQEAGRGANYDWQLPVRRKLQPQEWAYLKISQPTLPIPLTDPNKAVLTYLGFTKGNL